MNKEHLDLELISENTAVKFNFIDKIAYIEHFEVAGVQKTGKKYSKTNTFWAGMLLTSLVGLLGVFLDRLFAIPLISGTIISITVGVLPIKIFLNKMSKKVNVKEVSKVSKNDILNILKSGSSRFWILRLTNWIIILGLLFVVMIAVPENRLHGKIFIILILGSAYLTFIQSTLHPGKAIRARKILKKQLKEGRFND